jgi:hypothetical protein
MTRSSSSSQALNTWFNEDWKCLDYLDWLRWPEGFVCPWCASPEGWRAPDRRWRCAGCDRRVSATAGTIFHGTRTPLTVWFSAAWHLTSGKGGICATELQREMQGSGASGSSGAAGYPWVCSFSVPWMHVGLRSEGVGAPCATALVFPRRSYLVILWV